MGILCQSLRHAEQNKTELQTLTQNTPHSPLLIHVLCAHRYTGGAYQQSDSSRALLCAFSMYM